MKLQDYYSDWKGLSSKKNLKGLECLEAVKQNRHALKYVKEQMFLQGMVKVTANGKEVYISKDSAEALGLV